MKLNLRDRKKIKYIFFCLGILIFSYGQIVKNMFFLSMGMFIVWLASMIFSMESVREKIVYFLFQVSFFTFLISRPFVGSIEGSQWWLNSEQSLNNYYFAFSIVMLSQIGLFVGGLASEKLNYNKKNIVDNKREEFRCVLQNVSMIIFYVTIIFFFLQESEKLFYMIEKNYVIYYTGFHSKLPGIVHTIASFMKYSLCIFLATLPSKRKAFFPLALFQLSSIPQFIIGVRNPFVLNGLFIITYYVIRDYLKDESKWIGKIEKILLIVCIPAGIIVMYLYSFIRSGGNIKGGNIFLMIKNFFYSQGVTFDVLAIGYGWKGNLPERPFRNYTFGGFIDYIVHGRIGQALWGTEPLPTTNCYTNGRLSNNLSHNLAYAQNQQSYLEGHGWGSSFMLENYIDFGYIGVLIFSVILGILLIKMVKHSWKNSFTNTIILVSLMNLYFIPRAEATGWLVFIITLQFWICMLGNYMLTWLVGKYFPQIKDKSKDKE